MLSVDPGNSLLLRLQWVCFMRVYVCVCACAHEAAVLSGGSKGFLDSSLVGIQCTLYFTFPLECNRRIIRPSFAGATVFLVATIASFW